MYVKIINGTQYILQLKTKTVDCLADRLSDIEWIGRDKLKIKNLGMIFD